MVTLFGAALGLEQWALDVSPFTHIPKIGEGFTVTPLAWLVLVAAVLSLLGMAGFRRRDLAAH
jgi:ABC-2 type transport system permease protein